MVYKFSPSSLNLLNECPRCFWLRFNKDIRRPEGIFPSLPSGMDKFLKEYFDSYREKDERPPELDEIDDEVELFDDIGLLEKWRNTWKGIKWIDERGNRISGAVDDMLQKDDKLIVLDFKTRGYPLKEDTTDHYQDQLDIYNFLLNKNGYETEDHAYLLFYYPDEIDGENVYFNTELVKMPVDVGNAEKILSDALEVLHGAMPEPDEECEYCEWAIDYPG